MASNQPPGGQPPPGNMPPGYPPGYVYPGYPPGSMPAPQPPPFIPVPPASGSLWEAWATVARRPTLRNFAAWAPTMTSRRIAGSFAALLALQLVILGLAAVPFFVMLARISNAFNTLSVQTGTAAPSFPAPTATPQFFAVSAGVVLVSLALQLGMLLLYPLSLALFASPTLGTLRQRYQRVLRPWALALPPAALVSAILIAIWAAVSLLIFVLNPIGVTFDTASILTTFDIPFLLLFVVAIPSSLYQYTMQMQSGATGTNMNRWAVFGILLATGFIVSIVVQIVMTPLTLLVLAPMLSRPVP